MSNITHFKLKSFDLTKALSGVTLAFGVIRPNEDNDLINEYIYGFSDTKIDLAESRYRGISKSGTIYHFNSNGICSDKRAEHKLYIVEVEVVNTSGENVGTRCDESGDTPVCSVLNITSLNPREQIATIAMGSILRSIENPLIMDKPSIILVSKKAFEIAQIMLFEAAEHRDMPSEEVVIDNRNISSMTDRLLYKISKSLESSGDNSE